MKEDEVKLIEAQTSYFFKSGTPVHIVLKNDRRWRNGYIKEISADFIILEEFVMGDIPVFFLEIYKIEKFVGVI